MKEKLQEKKKRQEARLLVDLPAHYKLEKSQYYVECRIVDISAQGLGVEIKSFLEKGDKLKLKFSLNKKRLEINCSVMHILGKVTGLSYQDADDEDIEFIRSYVRDTFFGGLKK